MSRLSSSARIAIRRAMRARPAVMGFDARPDLFVVSPRQHDPLPPPQGTRAFRVYEDSHGGYVCDGPAVWAIRPNGATTGVWAPTRSQAIRAGLRGRGGMAVGVYASR